jgi:NAD(P)-dependent dehydrogenase (short-subunit alcohol dehydrogenase family)
VRASPALAVILPGRCEQRLDAARAAASATLAGMTHDNNNTLRGRVALVTGANTGIGLVTARELAAQGAQVFMACRSVERAQAALDTIRSNTGGPKPEALALDLGAFDSVRRCAQSFLARGLPLHLLINNAGLAGARGLTPSGFELAFGVNHMGHFLLTQLLLERIKGSGPARIVTVASKAHYRARGIDWTAVRQATAARSGLPEYGVSKLANVLFSAELGRRLAGSGVTTYALHPGVVASDVWRQVPWPLRSLIKLAMISTEEGAKTPLYCATAPDLSDATGLYYDSCRVKEPSPLAQDTALAAELWTRSEAWCAPIA